jgi:hypothetical protein
MLVMTASAVLFSALLELELRESLEMAVQWLKRDDKKGIRLCKKYFVYAAVTVRLL